MTLPPLALLLGLLCVGLVAALAALVLMLRRQRQLSADLHAAEGLREVLDLWQWRTDPHHRLTELRPPQGAGLEHWGQASGRPLLWDHFLIDRPAAQGLQASVNAHAPFASVLAQRGESRFLLHGTPRFGPDGRFAHYIGTARELALAPEDASAPLLHALPSPAVQVAGDGAASNWQVQGGNALAAQWLGVVESRLRGLPLDALVTHLPPAVRTALTRMPALTEPGLVPLAEGWELRVVPLPRTPCMPQPTAWWVFQRPVATAGADDGARAQDLEAFGYTVSHDLRAPVRVVEGFARILKEDYGRLLDRIGNDHLDRVMGAASRMNSMIDALLALSQLSSQPLSRQPINLSQLAGYIVDDLRRQSPERTVRVEIEAGMQVNGDATLMRVALENLLGNAWKYSSKRTDACIWFERSEHEGRSAFTVRDNGAGFDMRFADRLFGVFQRLHSANDFNGTGVGLASVRRIIRRHGGDIWAEGEVDRGSRFQFWIG